MTTYATLTTEACPHSRAVNERFQSVTPKISCAVCVDEAFAEARREMRDACAKAVIKKANEHRLMADELNAEAHTQAAYLHRQYEKVLTGSDGAEYRIRALDPTKVQP